MEKKNIMVQHGLCALAKTIKLMNIHEKYAVFFVQCPAHEVFHQNNAI